MFYVWKIISISLIKKSEKKIKKTKYMASVWKTVKSIVESKKKRNLSYSISLVHQ